MTRRLAIFGAGGHGRVTAEAAQLSEVWDEICFFDDHYKLTKRQAKWPIVGDTQMFFQQCIEFDSVVVAIGDNRKRLDLTNRVAELGGVLARIIHPLATISESTELGEGSVVLAAAVINYGAEVGRAAIINTSAVVEHDCILSDGVHICPNVALGGGTKVGMRSWVGIGAVTKELSIIGSDVVVGAGAVVVKDVDQGSVVVGNPAKRLDDVK